MKLNIAIGSPEWRAIRRKHVTATDAAAIMGLSYGDTVQSLLDRKISGEEIFQNAAMKRGTELEPIARELFEQVTRTEVEPEMWESDEHPFALATFDGINKHGMLVEIKCGKKSHSMALDNRIPEYYMAQMQHQLMVSNLPEMVYFTYDPECFKKYTIMEVKRDEGFICDMLEKEEAFYEALKKQSPKILNKIFEEEKPFEVTEEFEGIENMLACEKEEVAKLEASIDRRQEKLIALLGNRSARTSRFNISYVTRKGPIKYKDIPQLKGVDLEQYRGKESAYHSFKLIERVDFLEES